MFKLSKLAILNNKTQHYSLIIIIEQITFKNLHSTYTVIKFKYAFCVEVIKAIFY